MRQLKRRIILAGHAASGKDFLASKFIERGFKKDVSLTTRPARNGEVEGLTYHYVTDNVFDKLVDDNEMFEHVEFNGWKYGTHLDNWKNADVFIMTPSGISHIPKDERKDCVVVFIDIPEEIRRKRMDLRSDADTTDRRMAADKKDFKGFIDYDYRINDPNFNANVWIDLLSKAANSESTVEELCDTSK